MQCVDCKVEIENPNTNAGTAEMPRCRQCLHKILNNLNSDTSVGTPPKIINSKQPVKSSKLPIIVILFVFTLFLIHIFSSKGNSPNNAPKDPNAWKSENNWSIAYITMEDYVKQRLKSPISAKFPGVFDGMEDHVKSIGNQKYRITSYVDAQNAFGAMIRTKFIGEIQQISEERWQLISLELLE